MSIFTSRWSTRSFAAHGVDVGKMDFLGAVNLPMPELAGRLVANDTVAQHFQIGALQSRAIATDARREWPDAVSARFPGGNVEYARTSASRLKPRLSPLGIER